MYQTYMNIEREKGKGERKERDANIFDEELNAIVY